MKHLIYFATLLIVFASCKKDNNEEPAQENNVFVNSAPGSMWVYQEQNGGANNSFTVTSTSNDTSINGKSYHKYAYSFGGYQYLNKTNNDYYQFDSIPGGIGQAIERLYLKANLGIGKSWEQSFSITVPGYPFGNVPVKLTNKILEKGIDRTVNGITYKNVTHVQTMISSSLIPASGLQTDINSYFAPDYGMIENSTLVNLNYMGLEQNVNSKTTLVSADLK